MARSALTSREQNRIGRGPPAYARFVPALSVAAMSLLAALPIVSNSGWFPDFAFLMLIGWRLLRADPFPAWWAAPLGLINDLFTGLPIGFSIALWSLSMFLLELADRRTMFRDYWIEWVLAAVLIVLHQLFLYKVAEWSGARVPLVQMAPGTVIAILVFPFFAFLAGRLDRWRLGR
jgi:rod shape-determining protein MreD